MKILHCSDIHLGKRPFGSEKFSQGRYEDYFTSFNQLVDKAISEKIEVFMITGDLFDKRELSPDNLRRTEIIFEKLKIEGIKVLIIEGNHDNSNKYDEINSWLHYLEEKGYATRLTYEKDGDEFKFTLHRIEDVNFYGLGYPGFNVDKVVTELSEVLDEKEKNIILIHTAVGGGEGDSLPGLIKSETLKLLKGKAIYVAGGHFHSMTVIPKEEPYFFIPGSTEYWNILNERSDEKGAFIFDTNTKTYEFMRINPRKRITVNFKIEKKSNEEEYSFEKEFSEFVETLTLTGEELVIVKLEILDNSYVNISSLELILEEKGAFKGYVVPIFRGSTVKDSDSIENNNTIEDIEKNVISQWKGFGKTDVSKYLQMLKDYQTNDKDEINFIEVFDKMLEEMTGNEN